MTTSTPQQIRARSFWNLAQAHIQEGELREALPHLNACIELSQEEDDHPLTLTVLLSAAQCTHLLGDSEKALSYLANAESLPRRPPFSTASRALNSNGAEFFGPILNVASMLSNSRATRLSGPNAPTITSSVRHTPRILQRLLDQNQLASCASNASKVFTIASEHPDHAESPLFRVLASVMETRAFLRLGMIDEAHHACSQGLGDAETFAATFLQASRSTPSKSLGSKDAQKMP